MPDVDRAGTIMQPATLHRATDRLPAARRRHPSLITAWEWNVDGAV